jgi:hypothetical protein
LKRYYEFPGAKTYLGKTATTAVFKPSKDGGRIAPTRVAVKGTRFLSCRKGTGFLSYRNISQC